MLEAHDLRARGAHPIEVEFGDGERVMGLTAGYPPQGAFFFVLPSRCPEQQPPNPGEQGSSHAHGESAPDTGTPLSLTSSSAIADTDQARQPPGSHELGGVGPKRARP